MGNGTPGIREETRPRPRALAGGAEAGPIEIDPLPAALSRIVHAVLIITVVLFMPRGIVELLSRARWRRLPRGCISSRRCSRISSAARKTPPSTAPIPSR